jgi:rod shape-determining protein MreC
MINFTSSAREDITIVEKLIRDLYTPLQSGVSEFRDNCAALPVLFSDKKLLSTQIGELKKEIEQLSLENQVLREYEAEAKRLKELVEFKDATLESYDLLAASVIARSPNNWNKTLVINRGSKNGVEKDMAVISPDGLVGRVGSVSKNSAHISLISDRELAVGAVLQESRETGGIVEGIGNSGLLRMINIPYYSSIKKGDRVVTSGLSLTYPSGIDIGFVEEILKEPNGLLLSATVKPAVDFNKLEEVLVITGYRPQLENDKAEE